jgi:hypothetical protein
MAQRLVWWMATAVVVVAVAGHAAALEENQPV